LATPTRPSTLSPPPCPLSPIPLLKKKFSGASQFCNFSLSIISYS
jgi:hypothetical protein